MNNKETQKNTNNSVSDEVILDTISAGAPQTSYPFWSSIIGGITRK